MEFADAIFIGRQLLWMSLLLVAPVVAVSLAVGLLISVAQTVTSIQEQTLAFAPKIVAVVALIMLMLPWYLETLKSFTLTMFQYLTQIVK
ncbi:MAG: flagellar biosynthetic protein FliQ [Planctomycetota bacterium]|jgi:flagellar biosynthetic protein FliQ|nr:flagellar biosynthetic protein FliQ [Blastopirellula sp.]